MIRDRHDSRPRIHVTADASGARFRFGATGMMHEAASIGEAVERAVNAIEGRDAVVFVERVR